MTDILLGCLAAFSLFLAFGVPFALNRTTKRRARYAEASEIFHKKAEALASDPDTPVTVLEALMDMNDMITDHRGAILFLRVMFTKLSDEQIRLGREHYDREVAPFFKARPELQRAFGDASSAVFSAWLWNGRGLPGLFARRLFLGALPMMDGPRIGGRIVTSSKDDNRHHHNHHNGHAQAA